MDCAPYEFITQHQETDLKRFLNFKHRTFNATDTLYFIEFFRQHYAESDSLEEAFTGRFSSSAEKETDKTGLGKMEPGETRSEEHTSELQSLMRISYAVFCLKKKTNNT